jgi:hypothetical protein
LILALTVLGAVAIVVLVVLWLVGRETQEEVQAQYGMSRKEPVRTPVTPYSGTRGVGSSSRPISSVTPIVETFVEETDPNAVALAATTGIITQVDPLVLGAAMVHNLLENAQEERAQQELQVQQEEQQSYVPAPDPVYVEPPAPAYEPAPSPPAYDPSPSYSSPSYESPSSSPSYDSPSSSPSYGD